MTILFSAAVLFGMGVLVWLVPEDRRVVPMDADFQAEQAEFFSDGFNWR